MHLPDCLPASFTPAKNTTCFSASPQRALKWIVKSGLAGVLGLTLQVSAADPAPAGSTPVAQTTSEAPAPATSSDGSSGRFDWSKVPPVTAPSRPGMFIIAPPGPGYYSLWDHITGNKREGPPVSPHALYALMTTPAFDIDFRYLEKSEHEKDIFDPIKRIHLGDDFLLSFGGSFWYRYTRESDARLTNTSDNYHMVRSRFHADFWYQNRIRLFAEFLDARTFGQALGPLATDANHTDMLNVFADIKIANIKDGPAYLRVGRQELLYGSQRLISTLDWVNTRRTFQGVKGFWRTPTFDLDAFWVRPMVTERNSFDNWDEKREFFGLWGTYKPMKGQLADFYFLSLDDNRNLAVGRAGVRGDSITHTLGSRLAGDYNQFLYELEGMYQFGQYSNQDISAFAVASGAGYHFKGEPLNPQFWLRYDFASGDNNLTDGSRTTFNQLFPFGNYYLGWIDRVGRQNIHDFNAQLNLHPLPWAHFTAQYHRFYLANKRDFLYNAAGAPTLRDATGQSGSYVGDEIDFRFNIHVDRHGDVLIGYSKLFAGDFLKAQAPRVSPDLFYVQYNFRF
ncbi:Alginate export [Nitrosospira multiformis]|uniref:Alginate export n=1 Tax=Nitrosospira multiformis TaxID=1231 RepID=A0A1I0DQY8_9PROT|nr:alginate export family protein [Nitrosospira multiformis]SET34346.1 Alginate export [Nitrosospira multiformis]